MSVRGRVWMGRWATRLGLLAVSTAFALLAGEGLVRVLLPQQLILIRPDIWQPHDGLGWVQAADLDTTVNTGERSVRLITDAHGHRIGPDPTPEPAIRILALGDSYLAALQVDHAETFVALTESRLHQALGAPVGMVNAGVGSWGPSHYLLAARRELARQRYDQVVVFFYLGNDVHSKRYEHFSPKAPSVRHALRWPRNTTRREITSAWLSPINDSLETRSHLFQLVKSRLSFVLMRWRLSARQFPTVLLREAAASDAWRVTADVCRSIAWESGKRGVSTVFVLLPGICEVDREVAESTARAVGIDPSEIDLDQPSKRMAKELAYHGLTVIDVTPAMRAAHAADRDDLFGRVDVHLAPSGHRVVADTVAPRLLATLSGHDPRPDGSP